MLYFVVPLKSGNVSDDFTKVCSLLKRTLASICNQTCGEFRVLIVCHDQPDGIAEHPKVEYVTVPFAPPPPSVKELPSKERLSVLHADKGRKLIRGLEVARNEGSDYVMFVDADDLVSRRIAELCACVGHENGWFIDKGYRMDETSPWIVYRRSRFNLECGSSYILRTSKAPFPEVPDYSLDYSDYYIRRYVSHAHVGISMEKNGTPLGACPFHGAVYYCNDQAIFSKNGRGRTTLWWAILRALLKGKPVTSSFRAEFGM
jgi:glycosyltransferase involved in cell wall biosynthesis